MEKKFEVVINAVFLEYPWWSRWFFRSRLVKAHPMQMARPLGDNDNVITIVDRLKDTAPGQLIVEGWEVTEVDPNRDESG